MNAESGGSSHGVSVMSASVSRDRRPAQVNSLDLPLIGAAPSRQPAVNSGDDTWILPLITRAIERSVGHKDAAITAQLDKAQLSRQLAGDGHLSVRRLALLPESFWLELIDGLREHFKLDNDAERLSRAFDGVRAAMTEIERITQKLANR
jgi:hypothetical protein